MKSTRAEVYAVLDGERDHQDAGPADYIAPASALSVGDEILLMEQYLSQARAAWARSGAPETAALEEIRKVTAMGVRCMQTNGAIPRR